MDFADINAAAKAFVNQQNQQPKTPPAAPEQLAKSQVAQTEKLEGEVMTVSTDLFQKALAILDNEFIPNELNTPDVVKAAAADTSGVIKAVVGRLEGSQALLVKSFNEKTSALSVLLQKSLEQVSNLAARLEEFASAPIGNPKGARTVMEKSFVAPDGHLSATGAEGKPVDQLTKSDITTGFRLLIDEAGQEYASNPNRANQQKLTAIGTESGSFALSNMLSKARRAQISQKLEAAR